MTAWKMGAPVARRAWAWAVWMILVLGSASARAQTPTAWSALDGTAPPDLLCGHAWVYDPGADDEGGLILHLPPRDGVRVQGLSVRSARALADRPAALASAGDTLYIVAGGRGRGAGDPGPLQIASIRAEHRYEGHWDYLPSGRTTTLPPLTYEGAVRAIAATPGGLGVLTQSKKEGASETRLWTLASADAPWQSVTLPSGLPDAPGGLGLVAMGDRLAVYTVVAGSLVVYEWGEGGALKPVATRPLPVDEGDFDPARLRVGYFDNDLHAWWQAGGRVVLFRLLAGGALCTLRVTDVPASASVLPIAGLSRVAIVWPEPGTGSSGGSGGATPTPRSFRAREFSTLDGQEITSGPVKREGLLSRADVGVIGIVLVLVAGVVLLFVLRREAGVQLVMPSWAALARPVRRVGAASVDIVLATCVGGALVGVSPIVMWTASTTMNPEELARASAVSMLVAFVVGTLGEWLTARTPGKWLVGVAVLGLRKARSGEAASPPGARAFEAVIGSVFVGRPTLGQAMVRNLIKWGFPPITVVVLLDPNFRHPGDVAARTLVVEAADPSEGGEQDR